MSNRRKILAVALACALAICMSVSGCKNSEALPGDGAGATSKTDTSAVSEESKESDPGGEISKSTVSEESKESESSVETSKIGNGDNLTYILDSEGTLTISGTGDMKDYKLKELGFYNNSDISPFYDNPDIKKVIIEDGVTSIGDYAFYGCSSLTHITIPDGVTSIGCGAFSGCDSLIDITIPDSVTNIENSAFYEIPWYNNQLDGLVYAGKVAYKFKGEMPENTEITIKDGTVGIAEGAFYECTSLTRVTIPDSVTNIGPHAFQSCSSLTDITIPGSVTSIGGNAFYGCKSLTNLTIPDSVTNIGVGAFFETPWYSKQPDGVIYVGKVASGYKGKMTENTLITLEEGTTGIAGYAFLGYTSLTDITIPDSVTSIGEAAFSMCSSLTDITIPDSVTSIGEAAFSGCSSLKGISVNENNPKYSSSDGVLFDKYKETLICYPDGKDLTKYVIPDGVTSIGVNAFAKRDTLTDIIVPDSVTSIREMAFSMCNELKNIIIPEGVTSIGYSAFEGCESLTRITIPDGVTSIETRTFLGCTALTNITIPAGVTNIGEHALGYNYDSDSGKAVKQPDFKISGYSGTEAERYAKDNGFEFISLG